MTTLIKAAADLQAFFSTRGWRFCFIGGVALLRWGEPRLTRDLDVALLAGFGMEQDYLRPLLNRFRPRITGAEEFALAHRVLLVKTAEEIPIDISLAGMPYEERVVERASFYRYAPDIDLFTCSAEDLVVLKAFADRDRDWIDLEGVLIRQGTKLDRRYILESLEPLCDIKESPEIITKLHALYKRLPPDT